MTDLHCDVKNCANNRDFLCCRPDIMVGGPQAIAANQTYCANFIDKRDGSPSNSADNESTNPTLDIHCEVRKCSYNQNRACSADHIDVRNTMVNHGQVKTECATFENQSES